MKNALSQLRIVANVLDQIDVAICVFDADDRALLWNKTFLLFFPEHAGHLHVGESYRENLRRFYRMRLSTEEIPMLDRYVEEGVARHRAQQQAFEFDHYGFRVRVASLELNTAGRIRVWRKTSILGTLSTQTPTQSCLSADAAEALENLADGTLVADQKGDTLWANQRFHSLYGLPFSLDVRGLCFEALYAAAWQDAGPSDAYQAGLQVLRERRRFSGAPYELPLPDHRWVRVLEQISHSANGRSYSTHVDITALKRQQDQLERLSSRLEQLAITDALTGLANRRRFDEVLKSEWQRLRDEKAPLSLILIDVDHFKQINDSYGHPHGDEVLKALALVLTEEIRRAGDVIARYGGEEFAVLLPGTGLDDAYDIAERLRVKAQSVSLLRDDAAVLTVSCGVSCAYPQESGLNGHKLVEQADMALYQAKHAGRNRVVSAQD